MIPYPNELPYYKPVAGLKTNVSENKISSNPRLKSENGVFKLDYTFELVSPFIKEEYDLLAINIVVNNESMKDGKITKKTFILQLFLPITWMVVLMSKIISLTDTKLVHPKDMDSFNSGTIMEINKLNSDRQDYGNRSESNMDKYATKEELKTLEAKIDGQFNTLNAKLDGHFNNINTQFKNTDNQFKQVNSKLNWLFGIIAAVMIAGISKFFFG